MSVIHSYSSPLNPHHRGVKELFNGPVTVEEKIDGSQFSFMYDGERLHCRSKGAVVDIDGPPSMFARGVETARELKDMLVPGWTYRGEFLQKPKHNALAYDRVPAKNFVLFDIDTGVQNYVSYAVKHGIAAALGVECVPLLYEGVIDNAEQFKELVPKTSILGGMAEGIVAKNYARFSPDGKVLMGKWVTEKFKEVHKNAWGESNPGKGDILASLTAAHKTEARWQKAVQHLREGGSLQDAPQDIGPLLKEVVADIKKECEDDIKNALFKWAWPHIARGCISGLPQWYKEQLLGAQFADAGPLAEQERGD